VATEQQYSYFKAIYEEESARQTSLQDRAKTYLSLITFYSAFILLVVQNLKPGTCAFRIIFALMILSMLGAFLLSLLSMQIADYEAPNDPVAVVTAFGTRPPHNAAFFADRIVDYAVAYQRNSKVNNRKATQQSWAGYLMLAGIFLHAVYVLFKLA
jgi:hypothetical protein